MFNTRVSVRKKRGAGPGGEPSARDNHQPGGEGIFRKGRRKVESLHKSWRTPFPALCDISVHRPREFSLGLFPRYSPQAVLDRDQTAIMSLVGALFYAVC